MAAAGEAAGPSQWLIEERGSSLLVINPGSTTLRIGRGSAPEPMEFPHCCAYLRAAPRHARIFCVSPISLSKAEVRG